MLSVPEARERILSQIKTTAEEMLPLAECANRVLAVDVTAPYDLPLFDNSSMDGFALRAADASLLTLRVVADIPAGSAPTVILGRGQAARIMTGGQIPEGADAVIPVEDTDFNTREAGAPAPPRISFFRDITAGENIRPRGADLHAGDVDPVIRAEHAADEGE
jgi:molybdopterin molybdotransferase